MYQKRLLLLSVVLVPVLSGFAQGKISLMGKAELREINSAAKMKGSAANQEMIEAIVTFNDGWDRNIFERFGIENVTDIFENVVTASIPADRIEEFAESDCVYYVEFGNEYKAMMDFARPSGNVADVQNGFEHGGAVISYSGKGVVTGLMDHGIDPNHINFTDGNGSSRVKQAFDFNKNLSATTSAAVRRFTTDDSGETHGTHVAGIMAGSYNGNGDFTYMNSNNDRFAQTANGDIPYYGVATGSDIVMCSGSFTDANILKGVKAIVDYAKASGMPAVVNLSLGSNNGPHDGSESLEQNISKYAKDAVICIAAGNEGNYDMFAGKKFTDNDTEMKTIIVDGKSSGIDIWTNSSEPVTVSIGFYASLTRKFTPVATVTEAGQSVSANSSFTSVMSGTCTLSSEVNRLNNRYHVLVSGTFEPGTSKNNVALVIEGKAGQEVYVYGFGNSSTSFTSNNISGFTDGTNDGTINGLACAEGVIAVGSYNSRTSWPTFAGGYSFNNTFKINQMSPFSSYGSTYQGESLPHVSAPGAAIISSFNRYYTNGLSASAINSNTTAKVAPASGMTNYWGESQGTSMACPFVSGTIALWLEANPDLTADLIIDVFRSTAIRPTSSDPLVIKQWGAGKIDALAGIKKVLDDKASVGAIFADDERNFILTPVDGGYNVYVAGESALDVTVYDASGRTVATASADGNTVDVDTSSLRAGVYILSAQGNTQRHTAKIAVKK